MYNNSSMLIVLSNCLFTIGVLHDSKSRFISSAYSRSCSSDGNSAELGSGCGRTSGEVAVDIPSVALSEFNRMLVDRIAYDCSSASGMMDVPRRSGVVRRLVAAARVPDASE